MYNGGSLFGPPGGGFGPPGGFGGHGGWGGGPPGMHRRPMPNTQPPRVTVNRNKASVFATDGKVDHDGT